MFIGVDVGGTNTDAVVLHLKSVVCSEKVITTEDVTSGVKSVVGKVLEKVPEHFRNEPVKHISIGTTHFLNAVIQKRGLARVSVIRLCGKASIALPPFVDFPDDLRNVLKGDVFLADGGYYVDGRLFCKVDESQILEIGEKIKASKIRNVVIAGIYSQIDSSQEEKVEELLRSIIPDLSLTSSNKIGHMGLLERENASILNESLKPLCKKTLLAFKQAVKELGLDCPMFLTQNDGTLASAETCLSYPVTTFASGPTNSMRGAAFLSNNLDVESVQNALVVDIGGTTTDIGQLVKGFPREAAARVQIGGVYTNFRMPDLHSFGLGGGSLVDLNNTISVGPISVGCQLKEKSQCFGGKILTASDAAVAAGLCSQFGDRDLVSLDTITAKNVVKKMKEMLEEAVDRMKISAQDVPLIVVGGGSILIDQSLPFQGVSKLIIPDHSEVANAVGAALAQVSGSFCKTLTNKTREEALQEAKSKAVEAAYKAGALRESIRIVDVVDVPLSYLPGTASRYSVRAVGDLDPSRTFKSIEETCLESNFGELSDIVDQQQLKKERILSVEAKFSGKYPFSDGSRVWKLDAYDIEALCIGTGIMGCGGGGSSYVSRLRAYECLEKGFVMEVVKTDFFPADSLLVPSGYMGAPTVLIERLVNGRECLSTIRELEKMLQFKTAGILSSEIGGMNGIEPLLVGAVLGVPVADADLMGRAFPELQMMSPCIFGHTLAPSVVGDDNDLLMSVINCSGLKQHEDVLRYIVINFMGCSAAVALNPIRAGDVPTLCIMNTYTQAWHLGHAVLQARHDKQDPIEAILEHEKGSRILIKGKISDVERKTVDGFARGTLTISPFVDDPVFKRPLIIKFQNENLIALHVCQETGNEEIRATTPNLIVVVETDSGVALQTEDLKYGVRVLILVIPANKKLMGEAYLKVVGPKAFGYDSAVV